MAKTRVTFGRVRRQAGMAGTDGLYQVPIVVDGVHSGIIGEGKTPAMAKKNARLKLRKLGRR